MNRTKKMYGTFLIKSDKVNAKCCIFANMVKQ